jgi:hypothetical protein
MTACTGCQTRGLITHCKKRVIGNWGWEVHAKCKNLFFQENWKPHVQCVSHELETEYTSSQLLDATEEGEIIAIT